MHTEHWIKSRCPKCNATNWICDGDSADLTVPDVEAVKCWECHMAYWLDEEFSEEYHRATGEVGYCDSEHKTIEEFLASDPCCLAEGLKEPRL